MVPTPLLTTIHAAAALLAQGGGDGGQRGVGLLDLLPIVGLGLMAYFLFILPQKAGNKKFQDMLEGLKENDRVVTTGGLHGVVTAIQRDQGRITLRIDESSGAKVRVAMWAIDSVLTDDK